MMPDLLTAHRMVFIAFTGCLLLMTAPNLSIAAEPITGFRDLKFGMTQEEVNKLEACSSAKECIYELSEKNRYFDLLYGEDQTENEAVQTALKSQGPGLARITIDMGQYSEDWYKQLQRILGDSYRLTQDISQEEIQAFLGQQIPNLVSGYENGQILLVLTRRKFGNMVLKVIYQSPEMAQAFLQAKSPS